MRVNQLKQQAKVAKWHERIVDCRSSGMSVRAWCEMQEIPESTYYRWESTILDMAGGQITPQIPSVSTYDINSTRPAFAEVPTPQPNAMQQCTPMTIATIHCGKLSIEIHSGADAKLIVSLCKELQYAE